MSPQHFQGLRRASNKIDPPANPPPSDPVRKVDPTLNPITRRPGPGRGRPRKQGSAGAQGGQGSASASPVVPGFSGVPHQAPVAGMHGFIGVHNMHGLPGVHGLPMSGVPGDVAGLPSSGGVQVGQGGEARQSPAEGSPSMGEEQTPVHDDIAVDPSLEDHDHDHDHDEQPAKRPRLDNGQDTTPLEDEAVMNALAAHNNSNPPQGHGYTTDFNYGEA
ncbi:hypothetical protein B0T26DRAFT_461220 [Lasiosphaeria miniovina]|uniref:Uncharacterized protein n=1 Tax=Lasiosphaeria miniovina TaxID=1954250 RepID=A0AA39ZZM1_9PEZI|nr:uncharacterized protein B0T26DRAFT_461220 [Lasiosphaeria miniovina]KAK0706570.1 hypothetical protein B0T26DRAFT_461220 [Lasiosphaeria miniovina]